ncbi:Threonine synthase-like 2 [Seminavis robusta]|uniref:Threonine synthase-like 2 n=1 Tax=Seminavis robusta TaxID=568900 RepID=A0A9N8DWC5_9STRA|nr:Threonine synthase-like 2 [Seminavis robusta]|eukprot:Sro425_g140250.1 Threonine synthase-like 2 (515) ;mRNA; f:62709-64625
MKYTSTRDASIVCSFEEAICSGYAPDGGLFVPASLPHVDAGTLESWSGLTYPQLAFAVLRLFIASEEIDNDALEAICHASLRGFTNPDHAVPLRFVGGMYVVELFHGATFCFKDLGLSAVIQLLSFFATRRKTPTTLLVATTGDTGPAAVQAVSDAHNPLLTLLVHYPKGQISDFQRKQLTTVQSPYVAVAAFEGSGDDMDRPIKNLLQKLQTKERRLTGVNSYNIGRPLMQMVHYIWAYLRVMETLKEKPGNPDMTVNVVLPTGAMGNMVGGYMAKQMGIPLGLCISGVNVNDITDRVTRTGQFHKSAAMERTLSEAINIQLPYNFERLLFYLSGDHARIKEWMTTVDLTSKNDLPPDWLQLLQQEFQSERITDEEMCAMTRQVRDDFSYIIDPHTAVAFCAAKRRGYYCSNNNSDSNSAANNNTPVILLSTASPCKFQEAVTVAIGKEGWDRYYESEFPARGKALMQLEEVEPVLYKAQGSGGDDALQKSQDAWERQSLDIIKGLVAGKADP